MHKDNLSRYIRRVEARQRVAITAHGRVVAELVPPGSNAPSRTSLRFDELIAAGAIRPPLERGNPAEGWPRIRLPRGTAAELIDADRGEAERAAVRALRQFERRCYVVAMTEDVLERVKRPFPVESVRTLDAIHLATVEILGEPPALVTVLTRDGRVRENAIGLGYSVE
jgi:antitoxin (DNA-binding transcriptional repressor) of toxin-antitoxin stability system